MPIWQKVNTEILILNTAFCKWEVSSLLLGKAGIATTFWAVEKLDGAQCRDYEDAQALGLDECLNVCTRARSKDPSFVGALLPESKLWVMA